LVRLGDIFIVEEYVVTISKCKVTCLALLGNVKDIGRSILVNRRGAPVTITSD
jgi:hypothetical protein